MLFLNKPRPAEQGLTAGPVDFRDYCHRCQTVTDQIRATVGVGDLGTDGQLCLQCGRTALS